MIISLIIWLLQNADQCFPKLQVFCFIHNANDVQFAVIEKERNEKLLYQRGWKFEKFGCLS